MKAKGKNKTEKAPLPFPELMRKLKKSGIAGSPPPNQRWDDGTPVDEINTRIRKVLGVMQLFNNEPNQMIYFIMYDIEENKVRKLVANYLLRKGGIRVQKSIFLANTSRATYDEIHADLREVQECYENNDSIMLVPVSTDLLQAMKVVGKNIDFDLVLKKKNTLIF